MIILSLHKILWRNIQQMKETALGVFSISYIKWIQQIKPLHIAMKERIYLFCISHLRKTNNLYLLTAKNHYNPIIDLHIFI